MNNNQYSGGYRQYNQYPQNPMDEFDEDLNAGFESNAANRFKDDFDDEDISAPYSSNQQRWSAPANDNMPRRSQPLVAESGLSRGLLIIAALMILCALVFVGSQDKLLLNAADIYRRNADDDFTAGTKLVITNLINEFAGLEKVYVMPLNDSPGNEPNEDCYSSYVDDEGIVHSTYKDATISVDCYKRKLITRATLLADIAIVKIAHATQLRTAFARGGYGNPRQSSVDMARQNNAVVAINADMYDFFYQGAIIRQGVLYYENEPKGRSVHSLFIDENGDFIIMDTNEALESGFYKDGSTKIFNSFFFGPALVKDGEAIQYKRGAPYTMESNFFRNPRTAIGQKGPLEYVLVMIEGRNKWSKGATTAELADLMAELGCIQAYNLDGGQSSHMIFHGEMFNYPVGGYERIVSEIIYFASALPDEQ